ncbi:227 kDa spindle- and centromere-associated protein-like isoform X2 [Leptopilina boulardi]|uniref:227 kDa spindle- and centromere-associated protein-like isoform X2 n=1 Tax=Leptopilina boulardi TaxID=63433 RepID=UPI0021F5E548|nr:227 kDa spindle- and centromere-associated protein-like isoform X2 [Leptopilina boulardi]
MSERVQKERSENSDINEDAVDPRVQIELERLNTATDDINKLEVDLDEARATFRELLCESTLKIDVLTKKLGDCIEKSRPYYDARFKAKEALSETQRAAMRFERANSQHAAAKEMVYLAEEGLKTEGRCFDHAWQEMLNHATFRVNESEHERAISEAEHRRTTALYHNAEHEVQRLQRELRRAIAKSRRYYEMKAHFNQMLEEQKTRVSVLERSVGEAKMTYADALRNLERISDEIHRTRKYDDGKQTESQENSVNQTNTPTDSSFTGSPDSTDYTSDEYLRLPDKITSQSSYTLPTKIERDTSSEYLGLCNLSLSSTEPRRYIKRDRPRSIATTDAKHIFQMQNENNARHVEVTKVISPLEKKVKISSPKKELNSENGEEWTEISLNNSPEENFYNEAFSDEEEQIPYKRLPVDLSPDGETMERTGEKRRNKLVTQKSLPSMPNTHEVSLSDERKAEVTRSPSMKSRSKVDNRIANWISRSSVADEASGSSSANSSRRQSLDMLWNTGTGEKVKELLNHGMMMLNISSLTDRRSSEPKVMDKDRSEKAEPKGKKVPSPLEKTMSYLNADEEISDSESLASVEMLTEDQISSLMMEPDMNQVCQEILGTPLVEVCPLLQQLQQQ